VTGIRDYVLLAILAGLVPAALTRPWVGILGWFWIAYMVPHSLTWGFGRNLPLAAMVGGATLVGFILTKDKKPLPRSGTLVFVVLFSVQVTLSSAMAYDSTLAWFKWNSVIKILLMTIVTLYLFQSRERLRYLYLVPTLGLGFYGFKTGLWALRSGGGEMVWGPERSFFVDNNTFGLVLTMILPLLLGLSRDEPRPWLKRLMRAMFGLTVVAIIFTYSRGAFLALLVIGGILIWRSPWRLRFGVTVLVVALVAVPLLPNKLKDRIHTISQQESAETRDGSATGRIEAWSTAWRIAVAHPFFGEGFKALWSTDLWNTYYGNNYLAVRDVHSLYFEVLSEHGLQGFIIYMGILVSTLATLRRVRRRWRNHPDHGYLSRYADMTELAIYPYLVAGAFLGVAYFDLYFLLVGTSILLGSLSAEAELAAAAVTPGPAEVSVRASRRSPAPRAAGRATRPRHA
jgi:putative inorganic carbon (HCO3(-)) transporter